MYAHPYEQILRESNFTHRAVIVFADAPLYVGDSRWGIAPDPTGHTPLFPPGDVRRSQ